MSVVVAPPVTDGLLDLRFERRSDGRTALVRRRQRFPLRITAAMHLDPADRGMAFVYVQNPTGGVFAGDRLLTRVEAGAGARLHVTTQAATRIPCAASGEARQRIELKLEEDAYVEYAPDQLIPHAGARLEQELAVSVAPGSAFVGTELVSPGRLARGEIHAFELVRLRSEVLDAAGGELCTDVLQLEPRRRRAARRGLLGRHTYVGSVLAAAPGRDCEALASLLDRAVAAEGGVLAAAGGLPNGAGAYARVLAPSSQAALRALNAGWAAARAQLTGLPLPPRRK